MGHRHCVLHVLAAGPHRLPLSAAKRAARKLFAFDRGLGFRLVAGADEAGRGCLAGPLVAAAVLFDLDRIGPGEVRILGALNDSKQQTHEARAELYPVILRLAAKVAVISGARPGSMPVACT